MVLAQTSAAPPPLRGDSMAVGPILGQSGCLIKGSGAGRTSDAWTSPVGEAGPVVPSPFVSLERCQFGVGCYRPSPLPSLSRGSTDDAICEWPWLPRKQTSRNAPCLPRAGNISRISTVRSCTRPRSSSNRPGVRRRFRFPPAACRSRPIDRMNQPHGRRPR